MQKARFNPQAPTFQPLRVQRPARRSRSDFAYPCSVLEGLPDLLLIVLLSYLDNHTLLKIAATSRRLRAVVFNFSIKDRTRGFLLEPFAQFDLRFLESLYITAKPEFDDLPRSLQLLRLEHISRAKSNLHFSISQEASWKAKAMPVLKADPYKLILATGNLLWISLKGAEWTVADMGRPGVEDITDIALTAEPHVTIVSYVDGRIERLEHNPGSGTVRPFSLVKQYKARSHVAIESIDYCTANGSLLSVCRQGGLRINQAEIQLGARPWCTTFVANGDAVATGLRSTTPLMVHKATPQGLRMARSYNTHTSIRSSVLAVTSLSPDLILSGWYDGTTRLHDTRSPSVGAVLTWRAPYDDAAVYSLASSGNTLYSGSGMNGVVRLFDLRSPKVSHSLFLGAQQERGPVYSLVAEHERLFGALETSVRGIDYHRISRYDTCKNDWIGANSGGHYVDHATQKLLYSLKS